MPVVELKMSVPVQQVADKHSSVFQVWAWQNTAARTERAEGQPAISPQRQPHSVRRSLCRMGNKRFVRADAGLFDWNGLRANRMGSHRHALAIDNGGKKSEAWIVKTPFYRHSQKMEETMIPDGLRYSKDHEWVRMEGGEGVVGITDFAQNALGDITYVELPKVGKQVVQSQELGVIESVKAASDVFAPVAGTVSETNGGLENAPELINKEPYGAGWICRLKNVDKAGLDALMTAEQYRASVAKE